MSFKLVIAGSRDLNLKYPLAISDFVLYFFEYKKITEVISGGATGIDKLGEEYAYNRLIPIKKFIPDWYNLGKSAGPRRNEQMAKYCDAALVIWDGTSQGSANMIDQMLKLNKPVYEVVLKKHGN